MTIAKLVIKFRVVQPRFFNFFLLLFTSLFVGGDKKGPGQVADKRTKKIQFAVDVEVRTSPGKDGVRTPMKGAGQPGPEPANVTSGPAPIKMIGGRAWSPGIYRALRLMGKPLDVAWEKAFIRRSHF